MKVIATLLSVTLAGAGLAQTAKPTAPAPRPAGAARRATTARKPSVNTPDPALNPKGAPVVTGPAKTLYSLTYIDTKVGDGAPAASHMFYSVHYTGWLPDGTKFDSSVDRGEPITFPYGAHRVIIGWDTGFEGMKVGGKRRLFIPWQLAYGEDGKGPIPPKAQLIFDVELVAQKDPSEMAPPAPPTSKPETTTPPPASTTQPQN